MPKLIKTTSSKAAKIVAPVAKPVSGKPSLAPLGAAAAAQAPRSNVVAPKLPTVAAPTVAKPVAGIARTVRTIAARATNFGGLSDRDESYFSFYKRLAAKHGGTVTVAQIHASGERPNYAGSNKPHDAGAIVRLCKAGLISEAGGAIKLTADGTKHAG